MDSLCFNKLVGVYLVEEFTVIMFWEWDYFNGLVLMLLFICYIFVAFLDISIDDTLMYESFLISELETQSGLDFDLPFS